MNELDAVQLSNVDIIVRLAIAVALGAIIGTERELDGQDAGTRTHALLALGAGLFGVLSVGAFGEFVTSRAASNVQVDVTRIASYVAAGVGFLAGGAIIKQKDRVLGLTTAASLWAAAAAGLAAGLGMWFAGVVATVATLLMLLMDRPMRKLRQRGERTSLRVKVSAQCNIDDLLPLLLRSSPLARVTVVRQPEGTEIEVEDIKLDEAHRVMLMLQTREGVTETVVG